MLSRAPRLLAALVAACLAVLAAALPAQAAERPIVYVVVVDGLDGDAYDQGRLSFLRSLPGTYYRESRSIMVAETNPNHTAMITGAYGATSGIPGNAFALYAPLENEDSCHPVGPQDFSKAPSITSGENANCILAETMFAALKRQTGTRFSSAFATGKPKLGRLYSGRTRSNDKSDADVIFAPCSGDDLPGESSYCSGVTLNPISGYALDDATVMNAVLAQLAQAPDGGRPDFSFVNLHQVDSLGHATGTGPLYTLAVTEADAQLRRLVEALKARGEWERTVMIVLSDHSMEMTDRRVTLTSTFEDAGIPASAFTAVQNGSVDMIYLNDRTSPDRHELLKRMRAAAVAQGGVAEALYREPNPADGGDEHTVNKVHPDWHVDGERHGDLFVTSRSGTAFTDPSATSNPLPGNHGGPQTRDNFFFVTGGSPAVRSRVIEGTPMPFYDDTAVNADSAENVDVAATVAGLLGVEPPRDNQGRFLKEAFDLGRLPGRGVPEILPRIRVTRPKAGVLRIRTTNVGDRVAEVTARDLRTGKVRRLKRKAKLREVLFRGKRGRRYELRVRTFSSATGVATPLVKARATVRRG